MQLATQLTALIFGGATYAVPPVGPGAPPLPLPLASAEPAQQAASAAVASPAAAAERERRARDVGCVRASLSPAYGVS
jgi:hypothetical protein